MILSYIQWLGKEWNGVVRYEDDVVWKAIENDSWCTTVLLVQGWYSHTGHFLVIFFVSVSSNLYTACLADCSDFLTIFMLSCEPCTRGSLC